MHRHKNTHYSSKYKTCNLVVLALMMLKGASCLDETVKSHDTDNIKENKAESISHAFIERNLMITDNSGQINNPPSDNPNSLFELALEYASLESQWYHLKSEQNTEFSTVMTDFIKGFEKTCEIFYKKLFKDSVELRNTNSKLIDDYTLRLKFFINNISKEIEDLDLEENLFADIYKDDTKENLLSLISSLATTQQRRFKTLLETSIKSTNLLNELDHNIQGKKQTYDHAIRNFISNRRRLFEESQISLSHEFKEQLEQNEIVDNQSYDENGPFLTDFVKTAYELKNIENKISSIKSGKPISEMMKTLLRYDEKALSNFAEEYSEELDKLKELETYKKEISESFNKKALQFSNLSNNVYTKILDKIIKDKKILLEKSKQIFKEFKEQTITKSNNINTSELELSNSYFEKLIETVKEQSGELESKIKKQEEEYLASKHELSKLIEQYKIKNFDMKKPNGNQIVNNTEGNDKMILL